MIKFFAKSIHQTNRLTFFKNTEDSMRNLDTQPRAVSSNPLCALPDIIKSTTTMRFSSTPFVGQLNNNNNNYNNKITFAKQKNDYSNKPPINLNNKLSK